MLRIVSPWTEVKKRERALHGKWEAGALEARSTKGHKGARGTNSGLGAQSDDWHGGLGLAGCVSRFP